MTDQEKKRVLEQIAQILVSELSHRLNREFSTKMINKRGKELVAVFPSVENGAVPMLYVEDFLRLHKEGGIPDLLDEAEKFFVTYLKGEKSYAGFFQAVKDKETNFGLENVCYQVIPSLSEDGAKDVVCEPFLNLTKLYQLWIGTSDFLIALTITKEMAEEYLGGEEAVKKAGDANTLSRMKVLSKLEEVEDFAGHSLSIRTNVQEGSANILCEQAVLQASCDLLSCERLLIVPISSNYLRVLAYSEEAVLWYKENLGKIIVGCLEKEFLSNSLYQYDAKHGVSILL